MKKFLCSIFLLIFLSNCVYTKNIILSPDESNNIRGKKIAIVSREKPDFILKTPLHVAMLGGLLGYFDMVRQGNNIIRENNAEDPSILVAKKLQDDLTKDYDLKIITDSLPSKIDTYDVEKISKSYGGIADYVLDVRTLDWSLSYVAMDISNYAVTYSSQLKLIDVKNAKVVAENSCKATPYSKYQKNVMLADKAKILKQEFVGVANACSDFFKTTIFNIKK